MLDGGWFIKDAGRARYSVSKFPSVSNFQSHYSLSVYIDGYLSVCQLVFYKLYFGSALNRISVSIW